MTARENLTTALGGGIPEHTPLSVLDCFFADPRYDFSKWRPLFDQGLGLVVQCQTVRLALSEVDGGAQRQGRAALYDSSQKDAGGAIQSVTINSIPAPRLMGWPHEHWVKRPEDYNALKWIVENTERHSPLHLGGRS